MKVVTKRSKTDYHISHASGSGANEGIGVTPGVPYGTEDEQISWKSSGKSKEGSKSHQQSTGKSAQAEEPIHTTTPIPDWFQKPSKPPTPDRDWNKTLPAIHGPIQPWFSTLAQNKDPRESFNELMDTPLDFSAFVLNRLKVDTLTPELLTGPTFELMKGSSRSGGTLIILKKVCQATTYQQDWNNPEDINIRIDDNKVYTFKEGDYNRVRLQDIKDMLLLLVQGKLTNLNIEERLALGVSLRMFTRSIVIKRRVKDVQLGIESYQKKLNLTKPDTLMRIDELHKFSDDTLNDVRERAGAMIQDMDRQLRNKRIMRSLEKFIDGRLLTDRTIASLHREFSMTNLGALNYFLGISVTRDSSGMFLSQCKYAMEILECAHMVGCNSSRTPVDTESKLGDGGTPGTLDYGSQLFSSTTDSLIAYSDADWLPTLSRSSAEAEYRGVANAVAKTCWIRNLLRELHTPLSSAAIVYCDNVSAVYLSSNPVQHQRTKHIEIDIHFIRDLVATGRVRVLHVPSRF
ncbi:ribonuclease H-like domain-containing protein [Tanacetum coccineum]|uniref:Ribonuclease H-like domain-containing protein n=1 Tax=Tanacetum coccineum TaxID=301880 RepID=A0ABQ5JCP9_9ASTR